MKQKYFEANNPIKKDTPLCYFTKGVTRMNSFYSSAEKCGEWGATEFNILKKNAQKLELIPKFPTLLFRRWTNLLTGLVLMSDSHFYLPELVSKKTS